MTQAEDDRKARPWMYYELDREALIRMLNEQAEALKTHTWQPIETAPKDGRDILLTDGHWKRTGYWAKRIGVWSMDAAVALSEPTHWLGLP